MKCLNFICAMALLNSATLANAGDDISALRRQLDRSIAYEAVENISNAFGNWIDDAQWDSQSSLFSVDGWRQKYLVGFYAGPARIRAAETLQVSVMPSPRRSVRIHLREQPVITVSDDAQSAYLRTRLFHITSNWGEAGSVKNGMYPNDAAVLEDGIWKLSVVAIDEPYFVSNGWKGGWARVAPITEKRRLTTPPMMQQMLDKMPPDVPLTAMPFREGAFTPGPAFVHYPEVKPMWFHYRNPVSGRVPSHYCPDLRTCESSLAR